MPKLLIEILIVVALAIIFTVVFILNRKTKLPKGVTEEDLARCEACHNTNCKKRVVRDCEDFKNEE